MALFLLNVLVSAVMGTVVLYLPGRLWLRAFRLQTNPLENLLIALVSGTALFTLIYRLYFGAAHGWWLWPLLLLLGVLEVWLHLKACRKKACQAPDPSTAPVEPLSRFWPLALVALAVAGLQGWFIYGSGWPGSQGMSFLAWHGVDAPWHIYNIIQFAKNQGLQMPGFAGMPLKNYHAFADLLLGGLAHLGGLNPWHLYFRIAPFFYSVMLAGLTFLVTLTWKKDKTAAYLAAMMMVVLSNFGYVLSLLFPEKHYFLWDNLFWVAPPLTHLINPATSSSYLFFLAGFWSFLKWMETKKAGYLLTLGLVWGCLPGFKIYAGLLVALGLLTTGVIDLLARKDMKVLSAALAVLPLQAWIVLPGLNTSGKLIHFLPGYNLGTMLVAPDRLNLMSAQSLKALYLHDPVVVVLLMLLLLLVFLVGNLGLRVIALPSMIRSVVRLKQCDPFMLLAAVISLGGLAGAVGFVQTGLRWNTVQFFQYPMVLLTIISAVQLSGWLKDKMPLRQGIILGLFFALGLPGTIQAFHAITWKTTVGRDVLQAMTWFKEKVQQDRAVILRPLPENIRSDAGFALWLHGLKRGRLTSLSGLRQEARQALADARGSSTTARGQLQETATTLEEIDTAIIASLSGHNTALEDLRRASIMGYPVVARAKQVRAFYSQDNVVQARQFLEQLDIKYVILYTNQSLPYDPAGVPLKEIYRNQSLVIYNYLSSGGW